MNYVTLESRTTSENSIVSRPTRDMVSSRTLELASIAGREAHQIRQADYEQAKREVTGVSDFELQQAILDAE